MDVAAAESGGLVILGVASVVIILRGAFHCGRALRFGPLRSVPKPEAPAPVEGA